MMEPFIKRTLDKNLAADKFFVELKRQNRNFDLDNFVGGKKTIFSQIKHYQLLYNTFKSQKDWKMLNEMVDEFTAVLIPQVFPDEDTNS